MLQKKAAKDAELKSRATELSRLSNASYKDLINELHNTEDESVINRIKVEQQKRVNEVIGMGILPKEIADPDSDWLTDRIVSILSNSKWKNNEYARNIYSFAQSQENEANGIEGYRDNSRYKGLVGEAISSVADKVQYEGLMRRKGEFKNDEEFDKYLAHHGYDLNKLNLLGKRLGAGFISFSEDPIDFVGKDVKKTETGEELYERLKNEKVETQEYPEKEKQKQEETTQTVTEKSLEVGITDEEKPMTARQYKQIEEEMEKKRRLAAEQEYADFVNNERWSDSGYKIDEKENPYYISLENDKDRQDFKRRVTLHYAAFVKKRQSWSFDLMTQNKEMQELAVEDIQQLYETPGVSDVLHEYVNRIISDSPLKMGFVDPETKKVFKKELTLRKCTNRQMINYFREDIQNNVQEKLKKEYKQKGLEDEEAEKLSKKESLDAEQIGFNLAIVSNLFESLDARWSGENKKTKKREYLLGDYSRENYSNIRRERGFEIFQGATDIMNKPIRTAFNPIDALVEMATKEVGKESETGVFTKWASKQIRKSLRDTGYEGDFSDIKFEEMELIDDNDAKKYWRVEKTNTGGYKLCLPELYPLRFIGSYWEDASAYRLEDIDSNGEVKKGRKPHLLLEFIQKGEKIPWNLAYKTPGFSGYLVDASYRANVWDMFSTEIAQKGGINRDEMLKRLGSIDERDNESLIRWLGYAYRGIDYNKRLPTMVISIDERESIEDFNEFLESKGETEGIYDKDKMYFKWDRKPRAKDRFERWLRRTLW